jgi:tetratricopeptide (TPR) repeat protein
MSPPGWTALGSVTVPELPEGYKEVPEEDRKKAKVFFDHGDAKAKTGQWDYAISMYLQGLELDPDDVDAHSTLRDFALKRKASGGKDLGMFEKMKIKTSTKEEKANLLAAEKLLAYDPGNTDHMITLLENAHRGGFFDTVMWIGPILLKANADSKKPDFNKFIQLKDTYKALARWREAVEACHYAALMRPEDMDLQTEVKHLAAQLTMIEGKYGSSKSFRESVRDMSGQQRLLDADKGAQDLDARTRMIAEAEREYNADPDEAGKLMKLVDILVKTEDPDHENRAVELLILANQKTGQFRFRQAVGKIRLAQWNRMERAERQAFEANRSDPAAQKRYLEFKQEQTREELSEYKLWLENYPTDSGIKYEVAKRMFLLGDYTDAIPALQQVRSDPKYRTDATILLARAFLDAGFVDESVDTLAALIQEYQLKGDVRSIEMYYRYGRALEARKEVLAAIKAYSQVAQWNFNYADVQGRIKKLRTAE